MKEIRKYYLPNLCMTFTFSAIYASIFNLINNNDPTGYHSFILQFVAFLIIIYTANYLINKIEFKNEHLQLGIIHCLNYGIFMTLSYVLKWFGFRISNIIIYTIIFIIISAFITAHNIKIGKEDEIWINKMLEQRNNVIQETKEVK